MPASKLTSKGQITLPKAIRQKLGVLQGERVVFHVAEEGTVWLRREAEPRVASLVGLLHHLAPAQPVSIRRMRDAVRARAAAKARRTAKRRAKS